MIKKLLAIPLLIIATSIVYNVYTSGSGQIGAYTSAPSESNCTSCHSGSLISSGTNWNKIELISNFTGNGYIPDSTYTLTFRYVQSGNSKWGFLMTCLDAKNSKSQGTFSNLSTGVRTQTSSTSVGGFTRGYIGHNSSGNSKSDTATWTFKWKAPASNVGNVVFYANLNVANNNGSDAGDAIYAKSFTISPSTLLPTSKITLNDTHVCQNWPASFSRSFTNGSITQDSWKFVQNTTIIRSSAASPSITFTSAGAWMAINRVKNNKGWSQPDTFKFTVKTGAIAFNINSNATTASICRGDSVKLSFNTSSGYTYKWLPVNVPGNTYWAKDTGNIYNLATAGNGCQRKSSNTIKVSVNEKPSVQWVRVVKKDSFCIGDNVDLLLLGSGPSDSFSIGGGAWDKNQSYNGKKTSAGIYSITGVAKSTKGCIGATQTYTYTIFNTDPGPSGLNITNKTYTGFTVNWNSLAGASAYKISLDSGKTYITPSSGSTGLSHNVTGLKPGTKINVLIAASNNSPCGKTESSAIIGSTLDCPNLSFTLSGPNKICSGSSATIKILGLKRLSGTKILVDGVSQGQDTNVVLSNLGFSRTFEVTTVDSNAISCGTVKKSYTVSVDLLTINVDLVKNIDICAAVNGTYNYTYTVGSNADSSRLVQNNVVKSGWIAGTTHQVTLHNQDSIWMELKKGVCSGTSARKVANFTGALDAKFAVTKNVYSYTFTPNTSTGTHMWNIAGTDYSGQTAPVVDLTAKKGTTIKAIHSVTQTPTCASVLDTQSVYVNDLFTVNAQKTIFSVYPNPANQKLFVKMLTASHLGNIHILDARGKIVLTEKITATENAINIEKLTAGVYWISVETADGKDSQTITIVK